MSFKRTEKKAKKSASGGARGASSASGASPPSSSLVAVSSQQSGGGPGGGGSGILPEGARSKLWELFGQIEHEFESLYSENAAREFTQYLHVYAKRERSSLGLCFSWLVLCKIINKGGGVEKERVSE